MLHHSIFIWRKAEIRKLYRNGTKLRNVNQDSKSVKNFTIYPIKLIFGPVRATAILRIALNLIKLIILIIQTILIFQMANTDSSVKLLLAYKKLCMIFYLNKIMLCINRDFYHRTSSQAQVNVTILSHSLNHT